MNISRLSQLRAAGSVLAVAAMVLAAQTAAAAEGKFDRTLTVNGPITLTVGSGSGEIHVVPGGDGSVVIHARVRAGGWLGGNAEERVKQVVDNPPIEQTGNIIRIGKTNQFNFGHDVSIDYDISAPKQATINLTSGSGDVRVNGFVGDFKATSGSGNLIIDSMTGNGTANTGSGNIHVGDARNGLRAHAGSGNIEVTGSVTSVWRLGTGSGRVTVSVGGSKFDLDASSGSGKIECEQPITMEGSLERHHVRGKINGGGPTLYIETGSADIHIR